MPMMLPSTSWVILPRRALPGWRLWAATEHRNLQGGFVHFGAVNFSYIGILGPML